MHKLKTEKTYCAFLHLHKSAINITINSMGLIFNRKLLPTHEGKKVLFGKKKIILWLLSIYSYALTDQITEIAPLTCAPISELPYNIGRLDQL